MTYNEIKCKLKEKGYTVSIIAEAAGVSVSHCIRVLKKERISPKVAIYLANAL